MCPALIFLKETESREMTFLERTTSKQTTTLLLYIVSNVFYILGMAHRVHYATRIDWTQRKLHSNAVFWHSLAPE